MRHGSARTPSRWKHCFGIWKHCLGMRDFVQTKNAACFCATPGVGHVSGKLVACFATRPKSRFLRVFLSLCVCVFQFSATPGAVSAPRHREPEEWLVVQVRAVRPMQAKARAPVAPRATLQSTPPEQPPRDSQRRRKRRKVRTWLARGWGSASTATSAPSATRRALGSRRAAPSCCSST